MISRKITNKRQRRLTNQQGVPTEVSFPKDMKGEFDLSKPRTCGQDEKRDQERDLSLVDAQDDSIALEDAYTSDGVACMSSSPSAKVVPGKRIVWRNAIDENDFVRRDLHSLFVQADGPLRLQLSNFQ